MFLNTWASRCEPELLSCLKNNIPKVDVFCLTEVTRMRHRKDGLTTAQAGTAANEPKMQLNSCAKLIETFERGYTSKFVSAKAPEFACNDTRITFEGVGFGSLMAIKNTLYANQAGAVRIGGKSDVIKPRMLQWVIFDKQGIRSLVLHLHGVWIKENTKGDHPARLLQSQQVLRAIDALVFKHRVDTVVFGGDLNLAPDTKALEALLSGTLPHSLKRNLIKEHGVTSTRTPLYRKYSEPGAELLADYVLTSKEVVIKSFTVEPLPISDHAPLVVTFR